MTRFRKLMLSAAALVTCIQAAAAFELTSPDVKAGEAIPQTFAFNSFGCTGDNLSPGLAWKDAPAGTKSFALFVHDPDAKTGGAGFWHWVVVDIPANTAGLDKGAGMTDGSKLPQGARQLATDFGVPGWGGPCPPEGDKPHRYEFTVYALGIDKLPVPDNATASLAGFVVNSNALASTSLEAVYGR